ncbi:MAG TPA: HEAT repeat domain-containing protein [Gemmatimonadales bacterium]|nr:HEAT repeat domain-containing protein [Gemmatimonadales bacterium]
MQPAAAGVLRRLVQLLRERGTLSLGVARHQLIIEGVATDSKHPVLSELAGRLHRHHLGAVSFARGLEGGELEEALRLLSTEPGRGVEAIGLQPRDLIPHWDHLKLHAMTYDKLELLDEDGNPVGSKAERAKSAQLWIGLARAALAGGVSDDDAASELKAAVVAEAINAHERGAAYDQVIVGYLLQIAEELKTAGGREAMELRKRTSRMIAELRPETLRRLVDMGGDLSQRHKFVLDVTHGMAVDAVIEIVRAAASSSNQTISHSLVRMLSKLASHAERGSAAARPLADAALREQVEALLSDWQLEDPNPGAYGKALHEMSRAAPIFATASEAIFAPEDERVVEMALEIDVTGPTVWAAVDRMVSGDQFSRLLELLEGAPAGGTAKTIRVRIFNIDAVARLLTGPQPDFALIDRLVQVVGTAAAAPLLDALATADVRAVRRALLDRLSKMGERILPELLPRLNDQRWYVVRNLLGLLDDLPALPAGFSPATFRTHSDPRVRRQALKLELKHPAEREQALRAALTDPDPQTLHLALMATQIIDPPASTVPLLLQLARNESLPSEDRVLAIRALGRSGAPEALLVLVDLTDGGRTLLGRAKLPAKSPELIAALQALAAGWGTDDRATAVLARAAQSADADVRAATDPGPDVA